ncbi:MAG TPA: lamin tail domain-containing protein, partial [Verrucomicrobiae bacterium]
PGTELEYWVRVVDNEGQTGSAPKNFEDPAKLYRFVVPPSSPALRLTELVAANNSGLRDERNQLEDWLEVWNSGTSAINLGGYALSLDYFTPSTAWSFPNRLIQPNERIVVFCDSSVSQGPLHASFKLLKGGDRVFLIQTNTWTIVDSLSFGAMPNDTSFGVIGTGAVASWLAWPTPGAENIPIPPRTNPNSTAPQIFWRMTGGGQFVAMRWLGATNGVFHVDSSDDLQTWESATPTPTHLGEGLFEWNNPVSGPRRFYRAVSP